MINTYRLREFKNNVSLVLKGKGGNSVRYEFKYGNVSVGKYPTLTLTNKYQIGLLEESDLFTSGRVVRDKSIKTEEDFEPTPEEKDTVKEPEPDPTPDVLNKKTEPEVDEKGFTLVKSVTTQDELIAYVNDTFGKGFLTAKKALDFATKNMLHFPNLNMA